MVLVIYLIKHGTNIVVPYTIVRYVHTDWRAA